MIRESADGLTVDLQVVPRASRVAIGPVAGEGADARLRVAVTAAPVDGKANDAVIEALAEGLGVKRRQITLIRGDKGRQKTVHISGLALASFRARVAGSG